METSTNKRIQHAGGINMIAGFCAKLRKDYPFHDPENDEFWLAVTYRLEEAASNIRKIVNKEIDMEKEFWNEPAEEFECKQIEAYCRKRVEDEVDDDTLARLAQLTTAAGSSEYGEETINYVKDMIVDQMVNLWDPEDKDIIGRYIPREQLVKRAVFVMDKMFEK